MADVSPRGSLLVRIPADAKAWIASQAERNGSSQNSEIVRCIRERMDCQRPAEATSAASA